MRLFLITAAIPLALAGCTGGGSANSSGAFAKNVVVPTRPQPGIGCGPNGIRIGDLCRPRDLNDR